MARFKTDQSAEGLVLCLGPAAVNALLAIELQDAVSDPAAGCSVCYCRIAIDSIFRSLASEEKQCQILFA